MLDPQVIRDQADYVKRIVASGRSNPEKANVDRWLQLDAKRAERIQARDVLRQERNDLSKGLKGKPDTEVIKRVKLLKVEIDEQESILQSIEEEWQTILDWIPNLPVSEQAMPFGDGEKDNPVFKAWIPGEGEVAKEKLGKADSKVDYMPKRSPHWDDALDQPKHHLDLGIELGVIDVEQSAKVSGSRFSYLAGDLVLLQYALQQHLYRELLRRRFVPMVPPLLVRDRALYGTSHFPEGRDQIFQIRGDYIEEEMELNLVGSSEPTNFAFFMDRVLREEELPIRVFAYTPCFRSEVGSWGKDVRGIKRVHQFDKIEMDAVSTPEQSQQVFAEFLEINEWLWQSLQIPYRLARKCTGDAGYHASAEQVDPEGWLPGQQEFIEIGTDTNATDYQARRLNIKYQDASGKKHLVHTINDTGIPMGRAIIAILDNYQQSDGSVLVPEVLQSLMGGKKQLEGLNLFV